jgi:acetyl esterase
MTSNTNSMSCEDMKNKFRDYILPIILFVLIIIQACSHSSGSKSAHEYDVVKDVEWASPGGHSLTMDIYTPKTGRESYPVLIIFHGGAWLINDKSKMTSMSEYVVTNSEYVVCNVNYRLLVDNNNTVTVNQIIEDAFGAVLWIKENVSSYKGDPSRIIVTGDSAGGHLAAMIVLGGNKLESDGFAGGSFGFNPTYLPAGMTAEQVADNNGLDVQAAIFSYAAFDILAFCLDGFETYSNLFWLLSTTAPRGIFGDEINVNTNPDYYKAVSPIYNIPESTERKLPPLLCTVGSVDTSVTPASVQEFVAKLEEKGQQAQYWEYDGQYHAFLDGDDDFEKEAVPALKQMIKFMNQIFY